MHPPAQRPSDGHQILDMLRTLGPDMMRTVTPITGSLKNTTDQLGTGTFFRLGDFSFLVTAAHVLQKAAKCDYLLRVLDGTEDGQSGCRGVPLPKWKAYLGEEPADVAVLLLGDEAVSSLPNRRFVHLNEVALRAVQPGGCWVMGFPDETVEYREAKTKMSFNPFLLGAPIVEREFALDNHDPTYQFLLDADREKLWWPDGTPAAMPTHLYGISGCPIWQAIWPDGSSHPEGVRIVGVQTSYYRRSSVIKATHWAAVAKLLYDYYPELRNIIAMHLGSP